ncbi:MAG TPA: sigma-70 family RNA polymerase sigma factor [Mycobacteriales bacterium]|nr:sigma-70 family RNA polymerase sigma factor [Mycobacteriales bacterium]
MGTAQPSRTDPAAGIGTSAATGIGTGTGSGSDGGPAEAVIRSLYAEHRLPLLGYLRRYVPDQQQAEDVVQETMLRAWHNADALGTGGSVWGWLSTVARNIAIDRNRARQSRPTEVCASAAASRQVPDHADEVVTSVLVSDALNRLNPAHRAVLRQVYFANRTCAEAAAALGVPVGTVKSRLYWALRRLAVELNQRAAGGATAWRPGAAGQPLPDAC